MSLFNLEAKVTLDSKDYEKGIEKARTGMGSLSSWTVAKGQLMADGIKQGATAILNFGKSAITGYADYQQAFGGVETLFGAGGKSAEEYAASVGKSVDSVRGEYDKLMQSQSIVMENAKSAYKTAGMSATEYMETVTGFSASLLQSLGGDTEKAANLADVALTDMSDNINKFGGSIESVKFAYSGFSKGNFTMLDNLRLGYSGTKAEMERLLKDAEKLSGKKFDLSSYADIIEAIHLVQENMGIAGTTAEEAAKTISGSLAATESSWSNLVTGMADDNADLEELTQNFIESVTIAGENIMPRVETTLNGIGTLVEQMAPVVGEAVPRFITGALPHLLGAGVSMLQGMATGIVSSVPQLAGTAQNVVTHLVKFFQANTPAIVKKGFDMIGNLAFGIIDGLPGFVGKLPAIITGFSGFIAQNLPVIGREGGKMLGKLVAGIIGAIPQIFVQIPKVIDAITTALADGYKAMLEAGGNLLVGVWEGIKSKFGWLKEKIGGVVSGIKNVFTGRKGFDTHSPSRWSKGVLKNVMAGGGLGIEAGTPALLRDADKSVKAVKEHMTYTGKTAPYAETGMARSSLSMADTIMAAAPSGGGGVYHIHVNVDGHEMAETIFDPLRGVVGERGVGLA